MCLPSCNLEGTFHPLTVWHPNVLACWVLAANLGLNSAEIGCMVHPCEAELPMLGLGLGFGLGSGLALALGLGLGLGLGALSSGGAGASVDGDIEEGKEVGVG